MLTHILTWRQRCDLELLLNGAFAPLRSFMGSDDYKRVVEEGRLTSGYLWPIPVVLDLSGEKVKGLGVGSLVTLANGDGLPLAHLEVKELFKLDPIREAEEIYRTRDTGHAGVSELFKREPFGVSGILREVDEKTVLLAAACDFPPEYMSPQQLRSWIQGSKVVAFQTRNPLHWAHITATRKAIKLVGDTARLLIHPAVGPTKNGDFSVSQRMRAYRAALAYYPEGSVALSPLPLAMRMAGPREALWHALIRKNYGATHFIIGRGHADPGSLSGGLFYPPFAAHEYVGQYSDEIGITPILLPEFVYSKIKKSYVAESETSHEDALRLSGSEFRRIIANKQNIPEWFSPPEVADSLMLSIPSGKGRGFVVWFTGLPASGKSTLAKLLVRYLEVVERCPIFLLDGDVVRRHLSKDLGFSKADRDENIRRIGLAARQAIHKGGICVVAAVSPYRDARRKVRDMIEREGALFIEVFVNTPIETCLSRDPKKNYAKAISGSIKRMTGIDDTYEPPPNPEITINTNIMGPEDAIRKISHTLAGCGAIARHNTVKFSPLQNSRTRAIFFPRRFHAYNVGLWKSGTSSIVAMFRDEYRSSANCWRERTLKAVQRYDSKEWSDSQIREFILRRDEAHNFELESAGILGYLIGPLTQEFPDAKFIFTFRDVYSWCESFINHILNASSFKERADNAEDIGMDAHSRDYASALVPLLCKIPFEFFSGEDIILKNIEFIVKKMAEFWATWNERVLSSLPRQRSLMLRTSEISGSLRRIASFLDIPESFLNPKKSHSNRNRSKRILFSQIGYERVKTWIGSEPMPLMSRYFPGLSIEDVCPYLNSPILSDGK